MRSNSVHCRRYNKAKTQKCVFHLGRGNTNEEYGG